jgi:hypothetical protein
MAIYLTGMVRLLWTIGAAIGKWVSGFVFSPFVWAGVALFGFAAIALPVAGALRRRKVTREVPAGEDAGMARLEGGTGAASGGGATSEAAERGDAEQATGKQAAAGKKADRKAGRKARDKEPPAGKGEKAADPLEGMDDVEEILKRRGIS